MRLLKVACLGISTLLYLTINIQVSAEPEKNAKIDPSHSQINYDRCINLHRNKKYREAISACTVAIDTSHKMHLSYAYGYRASSYFRLGDKINARKDLEAGDKAGGITSEFVLMVLGDDI